MTASTDRLHDLLRRTGVFGGLAPSVLDEVVAELELVPLDSGDIVMAVGEEPDALYVIVSGRLGISPAGDDTTNRISSGRGQTVGELGLLTGEPRTATVQALRDTLVARLSRDAFGALLRRHPEAMVQHFAAPIITRLRTGSDDADRTAGLVVALVPADATVPQRDVSEALVRALATFGPTVHLDRDRVDAQLGSSGIASITREDPRNDDLVLWLNEQEASDAIVCYEADPQLTPWTKRCLRQADLVLVVAAAESSPEPGPVERWLAEDPGSRRSDRAVLLIHPPGTAGARWTSRWTAPRDLRACYHARRGSDEDYLRVARLLTGHGVGLVLSGGGARALAHIGVIRALAEAGVPVDAVAAVSGGAIVAGLLAMGHDADAITARARAAIDRIDYTLPVHALTSGRNWTNSMRTLFGRTAIEDLWIPFTCHSANLSEGQAEVHASGSLMHAVRASTAIPGLLPPVFHDGDVLVDGGLVDNLPTARMRAMPGIERVIAVDVGSADPDWVVPPFDYSLSGWGSLWQRLSPWERTATSAPRLAETLMRSISITNTATTKDAAGRVDWYLRPPVEGFGLLDFAAIGELAAVGHASTREQLIETPPRFLATHALGSSL
ncbi:cyclic nucleotide-binding and patatin-like phospholipase domain-containing protein [Euzebya pacifica]|uniref:cyclic nucleotide-binding and patatin-like phospholipase domain-containing protein n=1 Tax=Euzebya pacifica TaxID=1608957 RepID=UPI0030F5BD5A